MTGVGGGDDAVNLDPSLLADRHLGDRRDIAAVPHELREALIDPGRRLAPAGPFYSGVQNREMLRLQHLAPEFERVLPGGMGQLVDEAFGIDRIVVGVDAAPEAGADMRVAHCMVDQQVRYLVAELTLGASRVEALERRWVHPVLQVLREHRRDNRLPRQPHPEADQIAGRIQAAAQFALRDRMIMVVRHVLLARPDQLNRRSRHLHRDQYRLFDVIVEAPAAEAAAEEQLVHVAFGDRQA